MRVLKWIVVTILGVTSFAFIALPLYVYALGQWGPLTDIGGWVFLAFCLAIATGAFFGARYFFKIDVNEEEDKPEPKPPSRFAPLLVAHRRELRVMAQAGLALSLIRVVSAVFDVKWTTPSINHAVYYTMLALFLVVAFMQDPGGESFDWQTCPERMRPVAKALSTSVQSALVIFFLYSAWAALAHRGWPSGLPSFAYQPFVFTLEALFFSYGRFAVAR